MEKIDVRTTPGSIYMHINSVLRKKVILVIFWKLEFQQLDNNYLIVSRLLQS